jgi:formylglycine-generating enzyme required for sulfatase activity
MKRKATILPAALASLIAATLFETANAQQTTAKERDPFAGDKAGQVRNDNSLKLKLVWCPPGKFVMGSPDDEKVDGYTPKYEGLRGTDEDQREVVLTKGFWLGQYEVTHGQWIKERGTTPWTDPENLQGDQVKQSATKVGDDYPAAFITWFDAMQFCDKLTDEEHRARRLAQGWRYTLPTEAQWEYACRAGTTTPFHFGNRVADLSNYAWWGAFSDGNAKAEPYAHRVGTKRPNAWGLYDMHGNVEEWCRDAFSYDVKLRREVLRGGIDPIAPEPPPERANTQYAQRVTRGGSFFSTVTDYRSACRASLPARDTHWGLGFRVACVHVSRGQ